LYANGKINILCFLPFLTPSFSDVNLYLFCNKLNISALQNTFQKMLFYATKDGLLQRNMPSFTRQKTVNCTGIRKEACSK